MVAKPFEHALARDGIILASIRGLLTGGLHETSVRDQKYLNTRVDHALESSSVSFKQPQLSIAVSASWSVISLFNGVTEIKP
jgi:hypothetical protein